MVFGYSLLDPVVVALFAVATLYLLRMNRTRLLAWLPAALSMYFIVPVVTLLSAGQVVMLILTARMTLRARIAGPRPFVPVMIVLLGLLFIALVNGLSARGDSLRVLIRLSYYLGLLAVFSFCYEFARTAEGQARFLNGLVVLGLIMGGYGLYQILAVYVGLPMRGILRGTTGADIPFEGGLIVRINSLANEPKRLGYVLLVCALAMQEMARRDMSRQVLRWLSYGLLALSAMTLSGSYFLAVAIFVLSLTLFYPKALMRVVPIMALGVIIFYLLPDLQIRETLVNAYERRLAEVEIGLDGAVVYRQEFYAQDYIRNHPTVLWAGVGLGRYYTALNMAYGAGVGIGLDGSLLPMNSAALETLFDLGGAFTLLLYSALLGLIIRLKRTGDGFLSLGLLFLLVQSFSIQTLPFVAMFAGVGAARVMTAPATATG